MNIAFDFHFKFKLAYLVRILLQGYLIIYLNLENPYILSSNAVPVTDVAKNMRTMNYKFSNSKRKHNYKIHQSRKLEDFRIRNHGSKNKRKSYLSKLNDSDYSMSIKPDSKRKKINIYSLLNT